MLDGLTSGMREISSTVGTANRTINRGNQMLRSASRAANTVGGLTSGGANTSNAPSMVALPGQQAVPVEQTQAGTLLVPKGTCILIPTQFSQTGTERYLGKTVYDSITNMMNGSADCNNVMIIDANGQPSAAVYDRLPDGNLALKGTQTPIKFNKMDNGAPNVVLLNETEYQVVLNGMAKQGPNKFTMSEQGQAEDAENRSWWSRNWAWLTAAIVAAVGGVAAFFMAKRYKDKAKDSKRESSALSSKVTDLQEQVNELSKDNGNNTNSSTSNGNTLANNSIKVVDVRDTIISSGREYM